MSRRILTLCAVIFALGGLTTRAAAQCSGTASNQSCQFSASVTVTPFLTCTVDAAGDSFEFGSHPRTAGALSSNELNSLGFTCQIDPPGQVQVSFTLPTVLTRVGGTETVPITFGASSARLYDGDQRSVLGLEFNPAVGATFTPTTGILDITVGENGPNTPGGEVIVTITNASASGTYVGVGTVTIALP